MFDVSWEDPTCETVAQHRERKERPGSRGSSQKSAESSDSSRTQITQTPAGHKANKQMKASFPNRNVSLLKSSKPATANRRLSAINANANFSVAEDFAELKGSPTDHLKHRPRKSVAVNFLSAPPSNDVSNADDLSWSPATDSVSNTYEIQQVGEDSFVTRTSQMTISPQDPENMLVDSFSEVHISADPCYEDDLTIDMDGETSFHFPRPPNTTPYAKKPDERSLSKASDESDPPDFWQPPADWDCKSARPSPSVRSPRRSGRRKTKSSLGDDNDAVAADNELTHLTRHIRRMEAASPKIILERLKEEWTEVTDANIYKELEFEKQLWMLTALRFLSKDSDENSGSVEKPDTEEGPAKVSSAPSKVLLLHESQVSASFLATFTTATEIHHLSTAPLSGSSKPAIYPLTVPAPRHQLPYGPSLFTSIHSLNFPTLLASSSLPGLLRECHRILLSSGKLHLTILDPMPIPATLGPLLRAWLEKHLVLNLEKNFRCMNSGRLLQVWLEETGFSCAEPGSSTVIRFDGENREESNIPELTVLVGRMLWKEIWGGFVEGDSWWWDDEEVLKECETMRTRWECVFIEAVKRD